MRIGDFVSILSFLGSSQLLRICGLTLEVKDRQWSVEGDLLPEKSSTAETSLSSIVLVPLSKWGIVTRIGTRLAFNWVRIGDFVSILSFLGSSQLLRICGLTLEVKDRQWSVEGDLLPEKSSTAETSLSSIVLVPLSKWGIVTRVGT